MLRKGLAGLWVSLGVLVAQAGGLAKPWRGQWRFKEAQISAIWVGCRKFRFVAHGVCGELAFIGSSKENAIRNQ